MVKYFPHWYGSYFSFRKKPAKKGKGAKAGAPEKKEKKKPVTAAAKVGVCALSVVPSAFTVDSLTDLPVKKISFIPKQISGDIDTDDVHYGEKRLNLSLLFTFLICVSVRVNLKTWGFNFVFPVARAWFKNVPHTGQNTAKCKISARSTRIKEHQLVWGHVTWPILGKTDYMTCPGNVCTHHTPSNNPVADLRGGARDARPPLSPNSFIFM